MANRVKRSPSEIDNDIKLYLRYGKRERLTKFLLKLNISHLQLKARVESGLIRIIKDEHRRYVCLC